MTMTVIIIICVLLLIGYLFDLSSARTKIPSVILLLILGWGVREITSFFSITVPDLSGLLPILGTLGLILIVLEGALELEINPSKFKLIKKSFFSSFGSIILLSFIISYALHYFGGISMRQALVNAIPISVVSSSVAISSSKNLSLTNKEFIVYESSLSDIMGVVFFNFAVDNDIVTGRSFIHFGTQVIIICVVSFIATLVLSFLLRKIDHPIKHAPIIILLILIYAVSEVFHLPALIFILFFGLFLSNIDGMKNLAWINKLNPYKFKKEVSTFSEIVMEGAFLIRTFFFTLFGYSFETKEILNESTFNSALLIFGVIVLVRAIVLMIARVPIFPLLFVTPRGLVTILLFFGIPASMAFPLVNKSLIIQVIVLTALFMMIGLMVTGKKRSEVGKPNNQATLENLTIAGNSGETNHTKHTPPNITDI
jgi:Kef-type K+ transport system membrane component KefB